MFAHRGESQRMHVLSPLTPHFLYPTCSAVEHKAKTVEARAALQMTEVLVGTGATASEAP